MALIPIIEEAAGLDDADFIAAAADQEFENDERTVLWAKNEGSSTETMTVKAALQCSQGFIHDYPLSIDPGVTVKTPAFALNRFGRKPNVEWSNATGMKVVAVRQAIVGA